MKLRFTRYVGRAAALVSLVVAAIALAVSNAAWASPAQSSSQPNCGGRSTVPCKETDLSITKTAQAAGSDDFIYTITVKNNGTIAAEKVVATDELSKRFDLEYVKIKSGSGKCSVKKKTVTCDLGTLGAGKSVTIEIRVDVEPDNFKGTIKNSASVSSKTKDTKSSNNKSSVTVKATGKKK